MGLVVAIVKSINLILLGNTQPPQNRLETHSSTFHLKSTNTATFSVRGGCSEEKYATIQSKSPVPSALPVFGEQVSPVIELAGRAIIARWCIIKLMGIEKHTLDEIVRRITGVVPAARIILFGSAATGQMTRDSDIDLLILEDAVTDSRRERLMVREALRGLGYPFDVILMTRDRFEETKGVIGGIAYPANKYGKVIYDAA